MSYLVDFYNITEDPRVISKNIPQSATTSLQVYLTHPCNILYPTLLLSYNTTVINDTNYFYIDEFKKYYFITSVTTVEGGKMEVHGSIDVLTTYGDAIKECYCSVVRSESAGINWVPDDKFPLNTLHTRTKGESSSFTNTPFVKDSDAPWVFTVINDMGAVHN